MLIFVFNLFLACLAQNVFYDRNMYKISMWTWQNQPKLVIPTGTQCKVVLEHGKFRIMYRSMQDSRYGQRSSRSMSCWQCCPSFVLKLLQKPKLASGSKTKSEIRMLWRCIPYKVSRLHVVSMGRDSWSWILIVRVWWFSYRETLSSLTEVSLIEVSCD